MSRKKNKKTTTELKETFLLPTAPRDSVSGPQGQSSSTARLKGVVSARTHARTVKLVFSDSAQVTLTLGGGVGCYYLYECNTTVASVFYKFPRSLERETVPHSVKRRAVLSRPHKVRQIPKPSPVHIPL